MLTKIKDFECPICGNDDLICYIKADLSKCQNCEHVWQTSLSVTQEYGKSYCTERYDNPISESNMSHLRVGYVLSEMTSVLQDSDKERFICDIGYGMGHFLKTISKFGFTTYGIDVHGADFGIKECDYNSSILFDVVTMFDSLEHLENPKLVSNLQTKLYIVTLPNTPFRIEDFKNWKHYRPGEHLHYFSKDSLEKVLHAKVIKSIRLEDVIRKDDLAFSGQFGNSNTVTLVLKPKKFEEVREVKDRRIGKVIAKSPSTELHSSGKLKELTVTTIDGIGDVWWTYSKVRHLAESIHFNILMNKFTKEDKQKESRPRRAHQLIDMLPNCTSTYIECSDEKFNEAYKNPAPLAYNANQLTKALLNGSGFSGCVNKYMEKGTHLQDVWQVPLDYHMLDLEVKANTAWLKKFTGKNVVFIHGATYGNRNMWADIPPSVLADLAKDLSSNFGVDIGLTGSKYDNVDWTSLKNLVRKSTGRAPIMLVGEHLATTLSAIHKSIGWIGPICGVGIVALTMGDPIFALWPKHHQRMINTINNPALKPNPPYHPFLCPNLFDPRSGKEIIQNLRSNVVNWVSKAVKYRKQLFK